MASDHIVKSFDDELDQLTTAIARMGAMSQSQLSAAIAALLANDNAAAARVVKGDLDVDALEREVEAKALKVLAMRHPIARDLRMVLAAIRISIEFERICDFAKNIAKRGIALRAAPPMELLARIAGLADLARELLKDVLAAFAGRDVALALRVWASDEKLDEAYSSVHLGIVEQMRSHPDFVGDGSHLLFVAKNIERIGDHATNIAESVHFMVSGEALTAERPKGDTSSGSGA